MSTRTGFVMRSFIHFGHLVVSRGFGPLTDEVIIFPGELTGTQEGYGRRTVISASPIEGPKTSIRYPGHHTHKKCR